MPRSADRGSARPVSGPCRARGGRAAGRGYGTDVDLDVIRAWWSLRGLLGIHWLVEHGFDPFLPGCEVDVLRARM
jgi:hypothetical protein